MGRWMELAKRHAAMGTVEVISSAHKSTESGRTTLDQYDQTTKVRLDVTATLLTEFAAHAPSMPKVYFSFRETNDAGADAAWLQRIRKVIEEHQPGNNRVVMTIFALGGGKVYAEWRAVASRDLRIAIARLLLQRREEERIGIPSIDE